MTDIEADGVGSGCNFDVRASVRSSHRVEGVIGDINDEGEISGPWIVSRTLKLMATFRDIRITERVRFWVLCDGECKMLEHGYGEAWVTSMFQTLKLMATFRDISIMERVRFCVLCDGECKTLDQGYGECAIQFQDYSEAIVISMVMVEFQATGPR
ncbi:Coiled-Coil Domain-Containing Protein 62 [Manis pentadactyla]|nr:Coiled-Coil Domain-Containing Protein 62 [Manis pentadactyla]